MNRKISIFLFVVLIFAACKASPLVSWDTDYDVLVYGGNASGLIAGIAAKREGAKVLVVSPTKHLGGMVTGGLSATDHGIKTTLGGVAREYFNRIGGHYGKRAKWRFEPHVAQKIFKEMIAEAKLKVISGDKLAAVELEDGIIKSISTLSGKKYTAKTYIDASYEGDLLAKAGVSYTVGREAASEYNEELGGVYLGGDFHQWPSIMPAIDENGNLLPGVVKGPLPEQGVGDKKVQAYNYRVCVTNAQNNLVPFEKPESYDASEFKLLAALLERKPKIKFSDLFRFNQIPGQKYDVNSKGPFSTDYLNESWEYPDADYAKRDEITHKHQNYTKGLFYFLRSNERVPERLRNKVEQWGYCKDEWRENENFPPQLAIREARRMKGAYFLTQADIATSNKKDVVALASTGVDSHYVQRLSTKDNHVLNEGYKRTKEKAFAIPYRSITPKEKEVKNLLVTVAVSASHVSYSALRTEPVYMMLGHAAGVAASMSSAKNTAVQSVDVAQLQEKLKAQKQVLEEVAG